MAAASPTTSRTVRAGCASLGWLALPFAELQRVGYEHRWCAQLDARYPAAALGPDVLIEHLGMRRRAAQGHNPANRIAQRLLAFLSFR